MSKMMKAAVIPSFSGIETVTIQEVPIPLPGEEEVQIAIHAAGVNPVDWKIADGHLKSRMDYQFPLILGWDAAGEISQIGKRVDFLKVGDPVFAYCRKETMKDGSFAQFITLPAKNVVKKPKNITFEQAAAIPLSALTSWQALFDTAKLKAKEIVLIHAGAGGVGGFAIQMAKQRGAHVITTASKGNFSYVKSLGADEVIDYREHNFVEHLLSEHPLGADVIFDTVGGDTLTASYGAAKKGGRLVTIAGVVDQALAQDHHVKAYFVFVQPNGLQLTQIASLIEQGSLQPPPIQEIPFEDVILALRKSREGHTQGKLVLKI